MIGLDAWYILELEKIEALWRITKLDIFQILIWNNLRRVRTNYCYSNLTFKKKSSSATTDFLYQIDTNVFEWLCMFVLSL